MLGLLKTSVISVCALFSFNVYAADFDSEKQEDSPPEEVTDAPIHLYEDEKGRVYAIQAKGEGVDWTLSKYFLTEEDEVYLERLGARIEFLPDVDLTGKLEGKKGRCIASEYPVDARVHGHNSIVYGNIVICKVKPSENNRSLSVKSTYKTQWLNGNVVTRGYSGIGSHTAVILRFKPRNRGHGMFFGDVSAASSPPIDRSCTNDNNSSDNYTPPGGLPQDAFTKHNTRIEGWSRWPGYEPLPQPWSPGYSPYQPHWTATGVNYNWTCGKPWQDAPPYPASAVPKYNLNIHATGHRAGAPVGSNPQWVEYKVKRWNGWNWIHHFGPKSQNVTYSSWGSQGVGEGGHNGVFGPDAEGLAAITTTPQVGAQFDIEYSSVTSGWF